MLRGITALTVLLLGSISLYPQDTKSFQEVFTEAEYFFVNEDYSDALPIYLDLSSKLPENANIPYMIGVCYLNITGQKNLSLPYLEIAARKISAKRREGTVTENNAPYDALFELGRAYMISYKFDQAIEAFSKYAKTLLPDDRENLAFVNQYIKSCETAPKYISKPVNFTSENLGDLFNDDKPNFNPIISADGNTMAFMVSLKFYDAIMVSRMVSGKWSNPVNITPELESDGDMFISCLSANGNTLLLSRDDNFNSDIYFSSFSGKSWSKCVKLNKNINTKYWESHGFITEDGKKMIFASDRPGGFGGLDLYISEKVNNDWGPSVNMGPEINTRFNEDRPFLINNGKSLFFSSQGHESIGGFDIFTSELQTNGLWSKPLNPGYPFNTTDDNSFFMPLAGSKSGYYSIYKEQGGFGKEDIYKISFK